MNGEGILEVPGYTVAQSYLNEIVQQCGLGLQWQN